MDIDVEKVNHLLAVIDKCVQGIKNELNGTNAATVTVTFGKKSATRIEVPPQSRSPEVVFSKGTSRADKPVFSDNWPTAVPEDLLCSTQDHEEKIARAEGILDMTIDRDMKDLRFLDYGCGNGYVAFAACDRDVSESWGYDSRTQDWSSLETKTGWIHPNLTLTNDPEELQGQGLFDIIMLYDVLDHCERPLEVLNHCKRLLVPDGVLYVRCHPWASRHGGHLYRTVNKAYAHIVLDDTTSARKILRPLKTYKDWFSVAGFKICREEIKTNPPEAFFKETPEVKELLFRHWEQDRHRDPPLSDSQIFNILGFEFLDFVLQGGR